jgi:DNA-binding transcriptional LysR family regulator
MHPVVLTSCGTSTSHAPAPLIAASDLIITLPERVARIVCASHSLRSVPLPIKLPAFDVVLAWHERVHRDPANAWLRDQVLQAMRG